MQHTPTGCSRRAIALACEIARRLGVSVDTACDTAILNNSDSPYPTTRSLDAILDSLRGSDDGTVCDWVPNPDADLADAIVGVARAFDQRLELSPYKPLSASQIITEIESLGFDPLIMEALQSIQTQAPPTPSRLAVMPEALFRALVILGDEDASYSDIGRLFQSDQVLASSLLGTANSVLFTPVSPITTISRALTHIGHDAAKRVIVAATARPLFASRPLRALWKHSLIVANTCEQLARTTGKADPAEAFLLGLIHDIGRLAIESLPAEPVETYHRLSEASQCIVLADMAVLGMDHGELGAGIIRQWGLPQALVSAVQKHHHPELSSPMTCLLYLAEFTSGSDEDVPSLPRLKAAMRGVGLTSLGELMEYSALNQSSAALMALAG